jgi:hypothetical protein
MNYKKQIAKSQKVKVSNSIICETLLGAINTNNEQYILPIFAEKEDASRKKIIYKCPTCQEDVTLKKGDILRHHFAHKSGARCKFYDGCNESEIHKGAKYFLKSLIESGCKIRIEQNNSCCNKSKIRILPIFDDNYKVVIEHPFKFNNSNKKADVAYINKNTGDMIILEVMYKHKTEEKNRPEPWYELKADDLVADIDNMEKLLYCHREKDIICKKCFKNFNIEMIRVGEEHDNKRLNELRKDLCNTYYNDIRNLLIKCTDYKGYLTIYTNTNDNEYIFKIYNKFVDLWVNKYLEVEEFIAVISNNGTKYDINNIKKYCETCEKYHHNLHGICDTCSKKHDHDYNNRCYMCNIGICIDCDVLIEPNYKKCYNCKFETGRKTKNICTKEQHQEMVKKYIYEYEQRKIKEKEKEKQELEYREIMLNVKNIINEYNKNILEQIETYKHIDIENNKDDILIDSLNKYNKIKRIIQKIKVDYKDNDNVSKYIDIECLKIDEVNQLILQEIKKRDDFKQNIDNIINNYDNSIFYKMEKLDKFEDDINFDILKEDSITDNILKKINTDMLEDVIDNTIDIIDIFSKIINENISNNKLIYYINQKINLLKDIQVIIYKVLPLKIHNHTIKIIKDTYPDDKIICNFNKYLYKLNKVIIEYEDIDGLVNYKNEYTKLNHILNLFINKNKTYDIVIDYIKDIINKISIFINNINKLIEKKNFEGIENRCKMNNLCNCIISKYITSECSYCTICYKWVCRCH